MVWGAFVWGQFFGGFCPGAFFWELFLGGQLEPNQFLMSIKMQSPFFSLIIAAHTHEITTVTIEEMHYKSCIFTCLVENRMSEFFHILLKILENS